MSNLDLIKLKEAEEDLKKRSFGSGSKNWLQVNQITEPIDGRILDPLPIMNGIYYQEVPVWWINRTKFISSKMFNPDLKKDIVDEIIEEAEKEARKDKSLANLLKAKDDNGFAKIQFTWEYWIPFLQFEWEYTSNNEITGITNQDGTYNTELIRKYIVDERVKILVSNITCLRAINVLLTSKGGGSMLDPVNGKNIQIQKTGSGEKKNVKYYVIPTDKMPMPLDFYKPEKMSDPFEVAQARAMNDDYMASVIENYLYGDVEILEKNDNYRFPEIREKLKEKYKDEENEESQPKESSRKNRRTSYKGVVGSTPEEVSTTTNTRRISRASTAAQIEQSKRDKEVDDLPFDKTGEGTESLTVVRRPGRPLGSGSVRRRNLANDIADTQ